MRIASERIAPGQALGARHLNALQDQDAAAALTPTAGSRTTRGSFPASAVWPFGAFAPLEPFALADRTSTSFSVVANRGDTEGVQILGQPVTVVAGAGMTWSTDRWTAAAISSSSYVYLVLDREAVSATIAVGTSLPSGTDTTRTYALWYLPVASGAITWSSVVRRPTVVTIEGMV